MKKETLKLYRLLVPGIIIFIFTLPIIQPIWDFSSSIFNINNAELSIWEYCILIIIVGALYYLSKVRYFFLSESKIKIDANIKCQLITLCINDPMISKNYLNLLNEKKLMHVFYNIIDNDNSLKSKLMDVYFNGLIWSTIADLGVISIFYSLIYIILYWIYGDARNLEYSTILGCLSIISDFVLLPLVTKKQISLSNDQLEYMSVHHKNEICKQLKKIVES